MSAAAFLTTGVDLELLETITSEIHAVEAELLHQLRSQVPLVNDIGFHTLNAGGKRLRPALVSIAARSTGLPFCANRARLLGACMEMIHMATLIHDDVIDNAATRRGVETASARFGNTASILSGDVLLAKAMSILARDGDLGIIRKVSDAVVDLAEGEVRELESRNIFDLSEDEHFEILRMKTASFIQCCCEVGAMVAGAPPEMRLALGNYGHHIGLAFQIADDLLDYRGDNAKTGKQVAGDFKEGCATLPLIYLSKLLSDEERQFVQQKFGNGASEEDILRICGWMSERGACKKAEDSARTHVCRAIEALDELPDSANRDLLRSVAEFVVTRQA